MSGLSKAKKGQPITLVDNVIFNDAITDFTSDPVDALDFSKFTLGVHKTVNGNPTTIQVCVQYSFDKIDWYHHTRGPFGYLAWEDTAGEEKEAINGEVPARYLRIYCIATGTTAANTFTLKVKIQLMS